VASSALGARRGTDVSANPLCRLNTRSQLGQGSADEFILLSDALPFVSLGANQTAVMIAAGGEHACAVVTGGVKCWGDNQYGQLGLNLSTDGLGSTPGEMGDALPFVDLGGSPTTHPTAPSMRPTPASSSGARCVLSLAAAVGCAVLVGWLA